MLTLCYAIVRPGRKSGFRAGFRPDSGRESLRICPLAGGPKAGRMAALHAFPIRIRPKSCPEARFPAGSAIAKPNVIYSLSRRSKLKT